MFVGHVRVFLDCVRTACDFDYLRTEIEFVDWVRVREEADVHVLVTSQRTGSGGLELTFRYIGLDRFTGVEFELRTDSPQTATWDEQRRDFGRMLALGLVRYVATTPDGVHLRVVDESRRSEDEGSESAHARHSIRVPGWAQRAAKYSTTSRPRRPISSTASP